MRYTVENICLYISVCFPFIWIRKIRHTNTMINKTTKKCHSNRARASLYLRNQHGLSPPISIASKQILYRQRIFSAFSSHSSFLLILCIISVHVFFVCVFMLFMKWKTWAIVVYVLWTIYTRFRRNKVRWEEWVGIGRYSRGKNNQRSITNICFVLGEMA